LIAVVDDDTAVRTMLGRLLRLSDYEVCAFSSGAAFLASLAGRLPACVVLDVHMPELSGFEVGTRMRAAHGDVPVVFMTASDDPSFDLLARETCGSPLLRKPFGNDILLAAIETAMNRAR
jgi:two-component system response regulator FixJ